MVLAGWRLAKPYGSIGILVLATVVLALIFLTDALRWPMVNLAILYATPVLVAALVAPPWLVVVVATEAVIADAADLLVVREQVPWALTGGALVTIGVFAIQLALQRQQLADRAREAEEAQREARAAHRQLLQFLSMVSHELRQPLGVMVAALEIMADEADWVAPADQHARQMLDRSVLSMQRLVTDLHDAARIGAGRFLVHPEAMDLVAVCRQVLQDQQPAAEGHTLVLEAPDELDGVWDRQRMQQLLANLVSNAIKYSPDGGTVRVTIALETAEVRIAVSDEGVGIGPEDLARLFQPFTRLSAETRADGTGLGLYIAKAIVDAHGGTVEVRSEVGRGTTFLVTLPNRRPTRPPSGTLVAARD